MTAPGQICQLYDCSWSQLHFARKDFVNDDFLLRTLNFSERLPKYIYIYILYIYMCVYNNNIIMYVYIII